MPRKVKEGSRLEGEDLEAVMDLVPERFQSGVLDGTLVVRPPATWYSPDKPVIVEAANNHIKHGRYITANNTAQISKQFAYKRKKGYREMQATYIGSQPGEHELQIISLKEIIDALWDACNGSPQLIDCPHPELHYGKNATELKHVVAFKKDANSLFKLYENLVGRATETTDINVNQTALVKLLHDQTPLTDLHVIDLPPEAIYERRKLLESLDTTDGEFKEE